MAENQLDLFDLYVKSFIQRIPRYAVKQIGGFWKTKQKPLSDIPVKSHLNGRYAVASIGQWYPSSGILDIDSRSQKEVEEIRDELGLTEGTSEIFTSESPDSYHILFKPEYNGKPPTLRLLGDCFESFVKSKRIEIYPQANRPIRLPFGPNQKSIDHPMTDTWEEKLYWFEKLDPYDLSSIPYHQRLLDFPAFPVKHNLLPGVFGAAQELIANGLQYPSSRNGSLMTILYVLWRQNVPKENAVDFTWQWINKKHNGFSKDIIRYPHQVFKEIEFISEFYWNTYESSQIYPDSPHNRTHGYLTKPDIPDIVAAAQGSLPRMKFLYEIVKFIYPRRHRRFVPVHTDRLYEWAGSRTYLKYLNEFSDKGLLQRSESYSAGRFAKDIKLNWNFRDEKDAVLYDGRSVDSLQDTVRLLFKPDEFRQLLGKAGTSRRSRYDIINSIWKKK